MRRTRPRPAAVSVLAVALVAACCISFLVGVTLLFPGGPLDGIWKLNRAAYEQFRVFGRAAGAVFLTLGLVTAIVGSGLLRGRAWSWWLAVAIFALNGLGDAVTLAITRDVVRSGSGMVIAAGFLWLLLGRKVRAYFHIGG